MGLPLLIFLFILPLHHVAASAVCLGYADAPELDADCRRRRSEGACLKGFALRSTNLTASCIWHQLTSTATKDRQWVTGRGGGIVLAGIDHSGSVCAISVRMALPSSAKDRWGAYMRLLGGPQDTSFYSDANAPRLDFRTATCTLSPGVFGPSACELRLTAPKGYARHPDFINNAAVMEFFATDPSLSEQWASNGRLAADSALRFRLDIEGTRCGAGLRGTPPQTPAILDRLIFGPSSYQFSERPAPYFLLSYRTYRVSNVSGADWTVAVTRSLVRSGSKTPLTSLLMRDEDYVMWSRGCDSRCAPPPKVMALKGTYCEGVMCKRGFRGLGAKTGLYRLWVGYPQVAAHDWNGAYSRGGPVATPFHRQMVEVEMWPRGWGLAPAPRARAAEVNQEPLASLRAL